MPSALATICIVALVAYGGSVPVATDAAGQSAPRLAARIVDAGPGDYLAKLRTLKPGDTLRLAAGEYVGRPDAPALPVFNLHGTPDAPITITGPEKGPRAVVLGAPGHNAVRLGNASHVIVRDLEIDGRNLGGDGVNAQRVAHDITLENLTIRGVGVHQGTVGISTNRAPTWNWTIRGCTIIGAGTGMYLGNSDGRNPFVAGLIERNLIVDTLGYNVQIKHQRPWPEGVPLPQQATTTIIRHNVFSKQANAARGAWARPNLLVGDVPASGPGSGNGYAIYGNFFFQNPSEALFQGEGNVAFYANVLVNDSGAGVVIQPHNGVVRDVRVFGNTIVTAGRGIAIVPGADTPEHDQAAFGNAVFAGAPILAPRQFANVAGGFADAATHLVQPVTASGPLDLAPRAASLRGDPIDARGLEALPDWDRDFDGRARDWRTRGAYAGQDRGGRWPLGLDVKR